MPAPPDEGLRTRVIREAARRKLFGDVPGPARLHEYTLLEHVGAGGMGDVFAAYDPQLDRKIAIKVLRTGDWSDEERASYEQRLVREARAMAKLAHPNVNAVYQTGTADDQLFIAMEYIGGGTLRTWLAAQERPWHEIVAMFAQAGEGLCAAHEAGLVHRDFKPDNVLVGEDGRARVTDFGLVVTGEAREQPGDDDRGDALDGDDVQRTLLTGHGQVLGTPAYMAPEQLAGERTDPRTDVYAFCVSLYEALYGKRPFPGQTRLARTEAAVQLAREEREQPLRFPDAPAVPSHVRDVLLRGLQADPTARFDSMRALLTALLHDPRRARRRYLVLAGGVVMLGTLAVFGYLAFEPKPPACQSAGATARGLWDSDVSATIAKAFAAATPELGGPGIADAALERISARLPAYTGELADTYRRTCQSNARKQRSAEFLDLSNRCLDYRVSAAKTLIAQLERADAATISRTVEALDQLPEIADCSDPTLIRRADLVNRSEAERDRLAALEDRVASAAVQISLGHYQVLEDLDAVVEAAERDNGPRVLGRAELARARAYAARGWEDNATRATRDALLHAEQAGDDATVIQILLELIPLEHSNSGRTTVHNLRRILDAKIARLGSDPKLEIAGEMAWIPTLYSDKVLEAAELALELLPRVEKVFGDPSIELGKLLVMIGTIHLQLAQDDLAAASTKRAVAALAAVLGPEHPTVAKARVRLAEALFFTNDSKHGIAQLDLAERHLAQQQLSPETRVKHAKYRARLLALEPGREDEALALFDRALTIRGVNADGKPNIPRWEYGEAMADKARVLFRLGRLREAETVVEESIALRKQVWVPGVWLAGAIWLQVQIEIAAGTCTKIPQRLAALGPLLEGYLPKGEPSPEGEIPLAHCDLVAGKTAGVAERLRPAIEMMKERGTRPLWIARAQLVLARAIAKTGGDPSEVRTLAEAARPTLLEANDRVHLALVDAFLRQ